MRRFGSLFAVVMAIAAAGVVPACSSPSKDDGRLTVATAFYPIEELVQQVGGAQIHVVTLVPPGEEAHEYDPTPQQLTKLADADIVFFLGNGFQPNVEKAIASLPSSVKKVDLLDGLTLLPIVAQLDGTEGETDGEQLADGNDPHVWLDPANMQAMAATVQQVLAAADATHTQEFETNRAAYSATLAALDHDFAAGLAPCDSTDLVTSHRAFAYLAAAYGLRQVSIAGISPGAEPSAKSLEAVAAFAREHGVHTIFFEDNLPADLARTVADEIGATTSVLDPIESLSNDQLAGHATYVSVMRANLVRLQDGLGCS